MPEFGPQLIYSSTLTVLAAGFYLWSRADRTNFARTLSLTWFLLAVPGIAFSFLSGPVLPALTEQACFLAATFFLYRAFADLAGTRASFPALISFVALGASASLALQLLIVFHEAGQTAQGAPLPQLILYIGLLVPGALIRLLIARSLYRFARQRVLREALPAAAILAVHAVGILAMPLRPRVTPLALLPSDPVWFLEILGLSISCLFLLLSLERKTCHESQTALAGSSDRLERVLDSLPGMAYRCRVDEVRTLTYVSGGSFELCGYTPDELLETHRGQFLELISPDERELVLSLISSADAENRKIDLLYTIRTRSGQEKAVWEKGELIFDDSGHPIELEGFINDISGLRQIELALADANSELRSIIQRLELRNREMSLLNDLGENLQLAETESEILGHVVNYGRLLFPDHAGTLLLTSHDESDTPTASSWGETAGRVQQLEASECELLSLNLKRNDKVQHICRSCEARGATPFKPFFCVPLQTKDGPLGTLRVGEPDGFPESEPGEIDAKRNLVTAVAEEVALAISNVRLRQKLRIEAIRDPLTGLYNRRFMELSLSRELARASRADRSFAVMMLDLDHFKAYNDSFGHGAGDDLLRLLGKELKANLRSEDIICRYGGEEFFIMLPDISLEDCLRRAESIRQTVEGFSQRPALNLRRDVTVSVGIAVYPESGETVEALLAASDEALYAAKNGGRNQVRLYEASH